MWLRFLLIVSCGLVILGAGVVLRSVLVPGTGVTAGAPPAPQWVRAGVTKPYFKRYLEPIDDEAKAKLALDLARALRHRFGDLRSGTIDLRTTRVLRAGYELDASVSLRFSNQGDSLELTVDVDRPNGDPVGYVVEVRSGSISRLQVVREGRVEDRSLSEWEELTLSFGDLRAEDLLSLYRALRAMSLVPVGYVDAHGSTKLLVLEIHFPVPTPSGKPAVHEPQTRERAEGASAMVWLEPDTLAVRNVRILDGADRLVRNIEDIVMAEPSEGLGITSFRVNSIPTGSHTLFRIDQVRLKRN